MDEVISFDAFSDELIKIAEASYRTVRTKSGRVQVLKGVPVLRGLPKDPMDARDALVQAIEKKKAKAVLGYGNIAVRARDLDLKALGFKRTRIAVPLPGEKVFTPSFRSGRLHAHKFGDLYLMHRDIQAPKGLRTVTHWVKEGLPASFRRLKERVPIAKAVA